MKVLGFEGRWTEGSLFNSGAIAIEHDGTVYNATLGWKTPDWQAYVDAGTLSLIPEPIDLGDVPLDEWTGDKAPRLFVYHTVDPLIHTFIEEATGEVDVVQRVEFEAVKHGVSRWLLLRSWKEEVALGVIMGRLCLSKLSDLPDEELIPWHNAIGVASTMDYSNPYLRQLRKRAGAAIREDVRKAVAAQPRPRVIVESKEGANEQTDD